MDTKKLFNSILWGGLFIAAGVLWLLDSLNVIDFNITNWWPVIFIVIGISIISDGVSQGMNK